MAQRSNQTDKIQVDPLFIVPEGSEDEFVYTRDYVDEDETGDPDTALNFVEYDYNDDTSADYDDGSDDAEGDNLATPEDYTIVSQALRRAPGGQQVVDIIIAVEDIDQAVNYEIQVVKV